MSYVCMRMKKNFHIKGWVLNLVLIQRPGGTRKWPIRRMTCHCFLRPIGIGETLRAAPTLPFQYLIRSFKKVWRLAVNQAHQVRSLGLNRVAFTGVFRKRTTWNCMPWEAYRRGLYASHSRNIGHCTVKYINGLEIIVKANVTSKRSKNLRSKRFKTNLWVFVR